MSKLEKSFMKFTEAKIATVKKSDLNTWSPHSSVK